MVNLVYLAARDKYRVEREDKAGEGYVDFIFYLERRGEDGRNTQTYGESAGGGD